MKISVIVPCYNAEKYISKCLDSLVKQSIDNYEIIVVNDGSNDKSQDVIDTYVNQYPNLIKSFVKENGGAGSARNFGMSKAKGNFLSFIDGDDYIDINMLEYMYDYATKKDLDIVQCNYIKVYSNYEEEQIEVKLSNSGVRNFILSHPSVCDKIFRRTLFEGISFEDANYYEDLALTPTLAIKTDKIGHTNKAFYYYRQHDSAKSSVKNELDPRFDDIFKTLDDILKKFKKTDKYDIYKEEIEYIYITHLLRSATLRYLMYPNTATYLKKINRIMKDNFKCWKKNKYYLNSGRNLKIVCILAYSKLYFILKILLKLKKY